MASANLHEALKQFVKFFKAVEGAIGQLTKILRRAQLLEGEARLLKTQMSKCINTHDDATSSAIKRGLQSRVLECCINLLKNKLDPLKQKKSTACDMVVGRMVADAEGYMNDFSGDLR